MRVASLDYLGIVAARLRKDAISSRMDTDGIGEVVAKVTPTIFDRICNRISQLYSC